MLTLEPKAFADYDKKEQEAIMIMARAKANMIKIHITDEELQQIHDFAIAKAIAKYGESNHVNDDDDEYKRCFTGMLGEVALEKLFGVKFADWTIGHSSKYNFSDLLKIGYNIGIKTVELSKLPVVYKNSKDPELICVRRDTHTVILCGLALPYVLNNNLDINFVKSYKIRREGKKSAFTGFDQLIKITTLADLDPYNKINTYKKNRR